MLDMGGPKVFGPDDRDRQNPDGPLWQTSALPKPWVAKISRPTFPPAQNRGQTESMGQKVHAVVAEVETAAEDVCRPPRPQLSLLTKRK